MLINFTKMHGIGNDYIYINAAKYTIENVEDFAIFASERHTGIGADGVVLISRSDIADFKMNMYNADGSQSQMCGNAARCVGKYVYDNKLTNKKELTLETLSGIKYLSLKTENDLVSVVTINMGKAELDGRKIPINFDGQYINKPLDVNGKTYAITAVSMGNPHCITFVDSTDKLDLEAIGSFFEKHEFFPEFVNTEFIKVISPTSLQMRVWERGTGETMACGTGACAAVVAAVLNGYCQYDTEVTVKLTMGELYIIYKQDGTVFMRGGATTVYNGEIEF